MTSSRRPEIWMPFQDYGLAFDLLDMSFAEKIHTYPAYGIHTRGIYHVNGFHGGDKSADNASYARIAIAFTVEDRSVRIADYAGAGGFQFKYIRRCFDEFETG